MNQLPWHEQYDKLIEIILATDRAQCKLMFDKGAGWCVSIKVFEDPDKSYVTPCCATRETAIDLALKFVSSF